jgi:hypothetical protein
MRSCVLLLFLSFSTAAFAQYEGSDSLLTRMIGSWVLEGTIAGRTTTHDISAEWVLRGEYVQMHEVSRETDTATHKPAYEAIMYFGWDKATSQYSVLWLDNTGVWNFSSEGIGRGTPKGASIPFIFKSNDGILFHTTFLYDKGADTWKWIMDAEEKGEFRPFARVALRRK